MILRLPHENEEDHNSGNNLWDYFEYESLHGFSLSCICYYIFYFFLFFIGSVSTFSEDNLPGSRRVLLLFFCENNASMQH